MIVLEIKSKTYGLKHVFIDGEDFDKIKNHTWCIKRKIGSNSYFIATTNIRGRNGQYSIRMQDLLIDKKEGMFIDHINRNPLDNRKENLRLCTPGQNRMNSGKKINSKSQYKGVSFNKREKKYKSSITVNKKRIFLGYFKSEKAAAKAYNEAALRHHGDFACLNEID